MSSSTAALQAIFDGKYRKRVRQERAVDERLQAVCR
jgi:hypothetical protein